MLIFSASDNFKTYQFRTHAPNVANNELMTHPPITPSTVLFGEVAPAAGEISPSLVFPKFTPAKYAPTSLKAMHSQVQNIKSAPVVIGKCIYFGTKDGNEDAYNLI